MSNPVSNTSPGVQALSPSNFPHTPAIGFPPSFSPRSRTGPKKLATAVEIFHAFLQEHIARNLALRFQ